MTNAYNDTVDWLSVGRSRTEIKKSVQFSPILVSVGYKTPIKYGIRRLNVRYYCMIQYFLHLLYILTIKVVPPVASVISFLPRVVIWWSQLRRDKN